MTCEEDLIVCVLGRPRPKGSMRHVGNGRMIEQVKGSGDWRTDCIVAAREQLAADRKHGGPKHRECYPLTGRVRIRVTFTFTKPKSAPKTTETWPITRTSGDIDKLARNVLDALVDAGVLTDDSLCTDLDVRKRFVGHQEIDVLDVPGAVIRVQELR